METLLHIGLSNAVLATFLALLAAGVSLVCRRPALCHSLWLLVFLKLVTPPLYRVPVPELAPVAVAMTEEVLPGPPGIAEPPHFVGPPAPLPKTPDTPQPAEATAPPTAPAAPPPLSWQTAVSALWLTGAVLWWTLALGRTLRFRLFLRHAQPAPEDLHERTHLLARRLGLSACPEVRLVPAPVSPLLWALGRSPRLLLPAGLWGRLTEAQRDSLLVHELAHLRRRDHWVRRLELVVLGLYWWHPVVWWARLRLQDAEEECCDAWVTWALPGAGPAYASALVETVAFLSDARTAVPLGASGGGQSRHLRRRLTMILRGKTSRSLHGLALGGVLVLAAVLLPLAPGSAEPPDEAIVNPPPKAEGKQPASNGKKPDGPKTASPDGAQPKGVELRWDVVRDPTAGLAEQIEQARDEMELLEANLEVKRALLAAAEKTFAQARRQADRMAQLNKNGAVSEGEYQSALQRAEEAEAQLLVKRAELREPEVRLLQAKRRLEKLQKTAKVQPPADAKEVSKTPAAEDLDRLKKLETQLNAIQERTGRPAAGATAQGRDGREGEGEIGASARANLRAERMKPATLCCSSLSRPGGVGLTTGGRQDSECD